MKKGFPSLGRSPRIKVNSPLSDNMSYCLATFLILRSLRLIAFLRVAIASPTCRLALTVCSRVFLRL